MQWELVSSVLGGLAVNDNYEWKIIITERLAEG